MFLLLISILQPFYVSDLAFKETQEPAQIEQRFTKPLPKKQNKPNLEALANVIGKAESDNAGGYNAANAGSPMDLGNNGLIRLTGRKCHQITIGEIKQWQRRGLLYAVGRYQMIPRTLQQAAKWAGLKDHEYFSPENQDKMLAAILEHKRPKVWEYLTKGTGLHTALNHLAMEWSGLPSANGYGYYGASNVHISSVSKALTLARS